MLGRYTQLFIPMVTLDNIISWGDNMPVVFTMSQPLGRPPVAVPEGNAFGLWLRSERKKQELTGEALAFLVGDGMTQGRISAYERGQRKPHRDTVVKIAQALGSDPREALRALMADTPGLENASPIDTSADDLYALILSLPPEDGQRELYCSEECRDRAQEQENQRSARRDPRQAPESFPWDATDPFAE